MSQLARQNYSSNLPVIRPTTTVDVWFESATLFTAKLLKQLGLTLLATLLGAGREWVMKASSSEVSKRLNGNLPSGDSNESNRGYTSNNTHGYGSNNGYSRYEYDRYNSRSNGSETFPGF
jgi:hypothetical protein